MDFKESRELQDALLRIHSEYAEIPGLKLTGVQAGRLCNLPDPLCQAALTALVAAGFLVRSRDGSFLRGHDHSLEFEVVQSRIQTL